MNRRFIKTLCCLLALALFTASLVSPAEAKSFFTARRTFGILFLGGSAYMAKKAIDFRRDANRIYDAYKLASSSNDAETLYQRSSDRDTKSQMSIGLSVVLLVSGIRLLWSSGADDNVPKMDRRLTLDMESDIRTQTLHVNLKRRF